MSVATATPVELDPALAGAQPDAAMPSWDMLGDALQEQELDEARRLLDLVGNRLDALHPTAVRAALAERTGAYKTVRATATVAVQATATTRFTEHLSFSDASDRPEVTQAPVMTAGASREQYVAFHMASRKTRAAARMAMIAIDSRAHADSARDLRDSLRLDGVGQAEISETAIAIGMNSVGIEHDASSAEWRAERAELLRRRQARRTARAAARRGETVMVDEDVAIAERDAYQATLESAEAEQALARVRRSANEQDGRQDPAHNTALLHELDAESAEIAEAILMEMEESELAPGADGLSILKLMRRAEAAHEKMRTAVGARDIKLNGARDGRGQDVPHIVRRQHLRMFGKKILANPFSRRKLRKDYVTIRAQKREQRYADQYDDLNRMPNVNRQIEIHAFGKVFLKFGQTKLRTDYDGRARTVEDRAVNLPDYAQYVFARPDLRSTGRDLTPGETFAVNTLETVLLIRTARWIRGGGIARSWNAAPAWIARQARETLEAAEEVAKITPPRG